MTTKKVENKAVSTYILVDRSGSMVGNWAETLGSINAYVEELGKDSVKDDKITVAVFDSGHGPVFEVIRDAVTHETWTILTDADAIPRGGTPLYDSFSKIATIMESADDEKSVLVVMTDGWENASVEITDPKDVQAIRERLENKGWEILFLGADFDAMKQAASFGVSSSKTLNMSAGNYTSAMLSNAGKSRAYATYDCSIDYSDEDRKIADGK